MRLTYSHEWPVHLRVSSEEAGRTGRSREALHEIYDIAIALDTTGCLLDPAKRTVRLLETGSADRRPDEVDLPSPALYVSAGFPCHSLLVFDQAGANIADVTLSLHSTVHIAGVPATSEALLHRYHIGRVLIHHHSLYVADCEFDLVYVCDLAGDVRHVISWPEELCAPMGMCIGDSLVGGSGSGSGGHGRLFVCDSGHKRVRVYDLEAYRPVPGEDAPGHFAGAHTRGVCHLGPSSAAGGTAPTSSSNCRLVAGDFDSGRLMVLNNCAADSGRQQLAAPVVREPFAMVPGPLPDTVLVSYSSMQGDHSVKLLRLPPTAVQAEAATAEVLASCGGAGTGPGQFNKPRGLAFDPRTNRLYVVDARNFRVQVLLVDISGA